MESSSFRSSIADGNADQCVEKVLKSPEVKSKTSPSSSCHPHPSQCAEMQTPSFANGACVRASSVRVHGFRRERRSPSPRAVSLESVCESNALSALVFSRPTKHLLNAPPLLRLYQQRETGSCFKFKVILSELGGTVVKSVVKFTQTVAKDYLLCSTCHQR